MDGHLIFHRSAPATVQLKSEQSGRQPGSLNKTRDDCGTMDPFQ
ncbi:hypothetical protein THAOC_26826, partial [Thalassiosira oceanica]